jgi:BCD family chlorophyll transporter-like MFS transporter
VTLAKHVAPERKAPAATIVWIMMIAGFAVTTGTAGHFLDPYSSLRLVQVTGCVGLIAMVVTLVAVYRLEPYGDGASKQQPVPDGHRDFRGALREVWGEPEARRFTLFVFISMLAYSAQDLILEPFAGMLFGMTPGESTQLAGIQHGGVLLGMLAVAFGGYLLRGNGPAVLRLWTVGGCLASAVALAGIALGGMAAPHWPLAGNVFLLGVANGAFAVAAIASMMTLAGRGAARREGLRMGLWGAAQAIAFALGGFTGTVAIDVSRALINDPALAYAIVFSLEATLFVVAAAIGLRVRDSAQHDNNGQEVPSFGKIAMAEVLDAR